MDEKNELLWYRQNFEEPGAPVHIAIRITRTFGRNSITNVVDLTCTDRDLVATAAAAGKSTWDEKDIIARIAQDLGATVTTAKEQSNVQEVSVP